MVMDASADHVSLQYTQLTAASQDKCIVTSTMKFPPYIKYRRFSVDKLAGIRKGSECFPCIIFPKKYYGLCTYTIRLRCVINIAILTTRSCKLVVG